MIIILDCGSQLTHNIARRIRESNVYCEILPYNTPVADIKNKESEGLIISGGPSDVNQKNAPLCDKGIFEQGIPVLGICYGMQTMGKLLDGKVASGTTSEYGKSTLDITNFDNPLFKDIPASSTAWMSHGDSVIDMPKGFVNSAKSGDIKNASMWHPEKKLFGIQFHAEVDHTEHGRKIISNFLDICGCKRDWTAQSFVADSIDSIKEQVGDKKVIGGVSGGVDSTVAAVLLHRAIGDNFVPVFVDNGLLRECEAEEVIETFEKNMGTPLNLVDASKSFLSELKGVTDPEKKRKICGRLFIEVFEKYAKKLGEFDFLMQGTLYPDVIESRSVFGGPTSTIKSHHNVGGLPEKMKLKLVEPLRYLFKDEVRRVGEQLELPKNAVWRHPFPGPSLAIRIEGEITSEKIVMLRQADHIFIEELKANDLYYDGHTWQAFAVLTASKSVGVMGDERTYEHVIVLRAVTSNDGMTADWAHLPYDVLGRISNRIINEVKGVNRVVYDITSKPPGTIEWE